MPLDAARVSVVQTSGYHAGGTAVTFESWVFWNKPSLSGFKKAFDVSRTNPNWIYLGLDSKILKSEDGGETWITWTTEEGANDILVDPLAAGVIYYWSTDGGLKMMNNGTVAATLFDTETPNETALRIARQMNGGYLWEINAGATLKYRNLGTLSNALTSLSGATGLHAYMGSPVARVTAVDNSKIYYCDGDGTTFLDKTGDWSGLLRGRKYAPAQTDTRRGMMSKLQQYFIRKQYKKRFQNPAIYEAWLGKLGDGHGAVVVPTKTNFRYVRPIGSDQVLVVHKGAASDVEDVYVWVGRHPYRRDVLTILSLDPVVDQAVAGIESHADSHYVNGSDPVFIDTRQIVNLYGTASGMVVKIQRRMGFDRWNPGACSFTDARSNRQCSRNRSALGIDPGRCGWNC